MSFDVVHRVSRTIQFDCLGSPVMYRASGPGSLFPRNAEIRTALSIPCTTSYSERLLMSL
jgi:hypothetical protein